MENEIKQLLLNINQNVYKYMELVNSMQTNIFNQLNDIRNLVITSNNSILSLEERIKNIESVHLSTSTTDNINNIKQQVAENNQLLLAKINNMNESIENFKSKLFSIQILSIILNICKIIKSCLKSSPILNITL